MRPAPAAAGGQGADAGRGAAPDDQLVVGRAGPGDRGQALREPGHRRRHRAAACSCPTSRTPTRCPCPAWPARCRELAATARDGKTQPADLAGGTITITNVGVFGVDTGTPILTPGEAAILALGQVREAPWVHEGALAVRQVTTLALSFDHRIVDGDLGSAVLRDIGAMLTDPVRMIAWSSTRTGKDGDVPGTWCCSPGRGGTTRSRSSGGTPNWRRCPGDRRRSGATSSARRGHQPREQRTTRSSPTSTTPTGYVTYRDHPVAPGSWSSTT